MIVAFSGETTWDVRRAYIVGITTLLLGMCFIFGYIYGIRKRGKKWLCKYDIGVYNLSFAQIVLRLIYSTLYSYFILIYLAETLRLAEQVMIGLIEVRIALMFMQNRRIKLIRYGLLGLMASFCLIQIVVIIIDEVVVTADNSYKSYECQGMRLVHAISHFMVNSMMILISLLICSLASKAEHMLQDRLQGRLDELEREARAINMGRQHTTSITMDDVESAIPKANRRMLRQLLWMFVCINIIHLGWDIALFCTTYKYTHCREWMGNIGGGFEYTMLFIEAIILTCQHLFIFVILGIKNIGGYSISGVRIDRTRSRDGAEEYTEMEVKFREGDKLIDHQIEGYAPPPYIHSTLHKLNDRDGEEDK